MAKIFTPTYSVVAAVLTEDFKTVIISFTMRRITRGRAHRGEAADKMTKAIAAKRGYPCEWVRVISIECGCTA